MTPILSFTSGEFGREVVRLGDVVIGEVAPHNGRARATFILRLPDCEAGFRPAASIDEAHRLVVRHVGDWLLRAGVFYPGQEVDVEVDVELGAGADREARSA